MALAYGFDDENHKLVMEEGEISTGLMFKNLTMSHSSSLGSPISANSSDQFLFQCNTSHQSQEDSHSLINFRGGIDSFLHGTGSLLSFQHNNYQWNKMNQKFSSDPRLVGDINCFQTASNFDSGKDNPGDWLYSEEINLFTDGIQESATQDSNFHKRPHMGESMQATKKQCNNVTKKPKPKSSLSKDPQSIAAKNRRERISERLKILQELVPNGTKVDLVTMLEKAISYVKFLQLQVKVLATDEFWPVQGGKAPDISQVKEAIDAILSSQKDRNSS